MTQLDKNIALNLKRIRKSKNMSLDMLAERTGVSKSTLGQIERGESNPTVSTIGKIVEGLKVPFEQLIYNRKEIMVVPSPEEAPVCKAKEGEYRIYVMLPYDAGRNFEIYQGELTRNARMETQVKPFGHCVFFNLPTRQLCAGQSLHGAVFYKAASGLSYKTLLHVSSC